MIAAVCGGGGGSGIEALWGCGMVLQLTRARLLDLTTPWMNNFVVFVHQGVIVVRIGFFWAELYACTLAGKDVSQASIVGAAVGGEKRLKGDFRAPPGLACMPGTSWFPHSRPFGWCGSAAAGRCLWLGNGAFRLVCEGRLSKQALDWRRWELLSGHLVHNSCHWYSTL